MKTKTHEIAGTDPVLYAKPPNCWMESVEIAEWDSLKLPNEVPPNQGMKVQ